MSSERRPEGTTTSVADSHLPAPLRTATNPLAGTPLARAAAGLDSCVHCGFCLPACPTYVNLHDENDSPRGRIILMRRMLEGELSISDPDVGTHLDRCLGCRACETACPSGVPYGELLEATRATMRPARPMPAIARLILSLFKRTRTLAVLLGAARVFRATRLPRWLAPRLPARLGFPLAMLASTAPVRLPAPERGVRIGTASDARPSAASHAMRDTPREPLPPVVLLNGCVMQGLFSHTNRATAHALSRLGYAVNHVRDQHCCGALHAHAGDLEGARELARRNIAAFERAPDALIGVNSAGCGAMLKEYGHLLHDDSAWHARAVAVAERVRDVSELVAAKGLLESAQMPTSAHKTRVAYDPPCHLMHAQRITREPMSLLNALPQIELVPLADADQCCGSAGIYNLVEPDTSDAVLAPKLMHIAATRAQFVTTGNPGCLMQLGAGLLRSGSDTRAIHPMELLDAALGE